MTSMLKHIIDIIGNKKPLKVLASVLNKVDTSCMCLCQISNTNQNNQGPCVQMQKSKEVKCFKFFLDSNLSSSVHCLFVLPVLFSGFVQQIVSLI